ncbi:BolA-like protein 3 [Fulvia fulva]|uniref:BolA-like protein 3 n=1 Tax=Passalora fulva TaxID=5499 RepID=A0A9Q8LIW3_PASFU|nr:BolA-like protein 3 [Fulvia fulva]KAK4624699.1 BolA-like protein 3 [Fulvia fulva]KAK4625703.1 BolA-like protein 3 [Fulvia fulva]UJO18322.1 BolA-like protein 3 [Fulvia fulva]WPV15414.1 BolA-like protein 3 [Fulvia fulva]WPV30089.1 BolA-like protein 3 [Fulvia fulva]
MAARTLLPRLFRAPLRQPITPSSLIARSSLRHYSDSSSVQAPDYLSEGERKVFALIKEGLQPTKLEVQDISGGCGSMYGIDIVSEKFAGLPVIKQHRLVNQVLGEEIKKWHGVQLKTKAP